MAKCKILLLVAIVSLIVQFSEGFISRRHNKATKIKCQAVIEKLDSFADGKVQASGLTKQELIDAFNESKSWKSIDRWELRRTDKKLDLLLDLMIFDERGNFLGFIVEKDDNQTIKNLEKYYKLMRRN